MISYQPKKSLFDLETICRIYKLNAVPKITKTTKEYLSICLKEAVTLSLPRKTLCPQITVKKDCIINE